VIPLSPRRHRAQYDEEGNIIIPSSSSASADSTVTWRVVEEEEPQEIVWKKQRSSVFSPLASLQAVQWRIAQAAADLLHEGNNQYRVSARSFIAIIAGGTHDFPRLMRRFSTFLAQPVWVPRRRKEPRKMSRLSLFLIDTVRFGGTFATIFIALFVSLQSH